MSAQVTLFFHFRSPYSWLAVERLNRDPIPLHAIPATGIPESLDPRSAGGNSPRLAYIVEDVGRIAIRLGLPVQLPRRFDTDWVRPCAAFWKAQEMGQGFAFLAAAFRERFGHGADLGQPDPIAKAAQKAGLDADVIVAAMDDSDAQEAVNAAGAEFEKQGVCGVPFFIYEGQKFWGQDRLPDLRAAMGLPQVKGDFDPG